MPVAAPDALKQVLLNLVQYAREAVVAAPHVGAGAPDDIDIVVELCGADVVIEVRDRGPGIPSTILTRIFDPFFTTKDTVHGVGLGLFVAEGLIRTAGGRLGAGNRDGGGAWFRLELPIAREAVHAAPIPMELASIS